MTTPPRAVSLRGVEKRFGGVTAVAAVDLDVRPGELMVLVGPSGCGKSTLLRLIAGLEEATAGEVWIGGRRVDEVAPGDRDVAMVFQSYALYPHMTVAQNLGFGLRVRGAGREETERRVDRVAGLLGLSGLLARRPGQLSGGSGSGSRSGGRWCAIRASSSSTSRSPTSTRDCGCGRATRSPRFTSVSARP